MKLVLATNNPGKVKEFARILEPLGIEVITQKQAGADLHVEENGETFAENARLKAMAVYRATGLPTVADDSGLCVDALGGAPGVYSARFSGGNSADNRALLLKRMQDIPQRTAQFACAVCLMFPDGGALFGEGYTKGRILFEEKGEGGFGYDSLFFSDDLKKSFGEASEAEKNSVSHRFRALEDLRSKL